VQALKSVRWEQRCRIVDVSTSLEIPLCWEPFKRFQGRCDDVIVGPVRHYLLLRELPSIRVEAIEAASARQDSGSNSDEKSKAEGKRTRHKVANDSNGIPLDLPTP